MSTKSIIAPSILSCDFSKLGEEVEQVLKSGAQWIHVDVMDGHFVPNLTLGAPIVKSLRKATKGFLDCHLMISNPADYIEGFIAAGADNITLHVESNGDVESMLRQIQSQGVKAGITLRPGTDVQTVESFLPWIDVVLVMTVEPGFGGQSFMVDQVAKVKWLREKIQSLGAKALIQVDGGINEKTVFQVKEADVYVAGSYVFKHNDYAVAIKTLKELSQ